MSRDHLQAFARPLRASRHSFQYSRHEPGMETAQGAKRTVLQVSVITPRSLSADAIRFAVPLKNKSEMLLEGYLRNQGYDDFDFEPEIAGTTRRPDCRLRWAGADVLLEVKEFRGNADDFRSGFGSFDPYQPDRSNSKGTTRTYRAARPAESKVCLAEREWLCRRSVRSSVSEATNLSRDWSARLVVHAHDQKFVGMPLE